MRFLFVSRRGASLSLAKRIVQEGHVVHFFVNNLLYKVLGQGIIDKAKIGEFHNCDVAIFDESGMGEYASVMAKGKPVIGGSKFADLFNNDIEYKQKVLAKAGLQLGSYSDGEKIYVTGWYNGFNFVHPFHSYFKKTKFMENNLGIDTESMGCLLWYHKANKLTNHTIHKIRNELKKTGYIGAVTFECNVTEGAMAITNVHLGFTYDNTYACLEGVRQDYGELLYRLAFDSIKRMKTSSDWLTATRVTIPPYPLPKSDAVPKYTRVEGLNKENLKHIWLRDVMYEDGMYSSANCDGYLMTVTSRGLTPRKAFRRTHRTINNLKIVNVQYRLDIGDGLDERYKKIKDWGWFN